MWFGTWRSGERGGPRMRDEAGFLRAILDDPDDETNRLVHADWLEENGDDDRPAFIRGELECDPFKRLNPMLDDWHWDAYCDTMWGGGDWGRARADFIRMQLHTAFLSDEGGDLGLVKSDPDQLLREHGKRW